MVDEWTECDGLRVPLSVLLRSLESPTFVVWYVFLGEVWGSVVWGIMDVNEFTQSIYFATLT